jgi:hypothetical protein
MSTRAITPRPLSAALAAAVALVLARPAAAQLPDSEGFFTILSETTGLTGDCAFQVFDRATLAAAHVGYCGAYEPDDFSFDLEAFGRIERTGVVHGRAYASGYALLDATDLREASVRTYVTFQNDLFLLPRVGATAAREIVFGAFLEGSAVVVTGNGAFAASGGRLTLDAYDVAAGAGDGVDLTIDGLPSPDGFEVRRVDRTLTVPLSFDALLGARPVQVGVTIDLTASAEASFEDAWDREAFIDFLAGADFGSSGGIDPGSIRLYGVDALGARVEVTDQYLLRWAGDAAVVPEPAPLALVAGGLLATVAAAGARRRTR